MTSGVELFSDTLHGTERSDLPSVATSAIEVRRARCSSMDIGKAISPALSCGKEAPEERMGRRGGERAKGRVINEGLSSLIFHFETETEEESVRFIVVNV